MTVAAPPSGSADEAGAPPRVGPLPRRPLLIATGAAAAFLAVCQATLLLLHNRVFLGLEMALGLTKLAVLVAVVTLLLLVPVVLPLRRLHPAWRAGDRLRASWSVSFGLTAALVGWMIANLLTSSPVVPKTVGPWLDATAALGLGLAACGLQATYRWLRSAALLALVLLALCFVPYPPPPAKPEEVATRPAAVERAERPDVVLVSIDTLRADHLGAYGRSPSITPAMDRVAAEGVVFSRALAASPWTNPSVASLLTGLPTVRHDAGRPLGAGLTFRRSPLGPRFTTLAERFAAAGYRTRAVVANGFLSAESGMTQGFQQFANPFASAALASLIRELPLTRLAVALTPAETWGDYRAQGVTDKALGWLAEGDQAPLFLWVHYIDPHSPYQADPALLDPAVLGEMMHQAHPPPRPDGTVVGEVFAATDLVRGGTLWLGPRDRQRLRDHYAREVGYADTHVGRLFEALRARAARRRVAAVLTADHGEEFWDHGHFEHGHDYYREVTWIPLVFWGPGVVPEGRTVAEVVGLVDVAPTILELAGLPVPAAEAPGDGRSVADLWAAAPTGRPSRAAVPRFSGGNLYGLPAVLVEDGQWRSILRANGAQELFEVPRDPQERRNLAFQHPDVAERYRHALEPQLAALLHTGDAATAQEPSPEQIEGLRALGYVR